MFIIPDNINECKSCKFCGKRDKLVNVIMYMYIKINLEFSFRPHDDADKRVL